MNGNGEASWCVSMEVERVMEKMKPNNPGYYMVMTKQKDAKFSVWLAKDS